jgi:hypothetical protein
VLEESETGPAGSTNVDRRGMEAVKAVEEIGEAEGEAAGEE